MKKTIFLVFLALLIVPQLGQAQKEKSKDKNVLFIMVDDLNNTLGTYGHPIVKTPNIDELASMGVQYNNAYCNFAVCGPSRGSLLTGLRPETLGILDNKTPLQPMLTDKTTLPRLFKENGYETMGLGKIFTEELRIMEILELGMPFINLKKQA